MKGVKGEIGLAQHRVPYLREHAAFNEARRSLTGYQANPEGALATLRQVFFRSLDLVENLCTRGIVLNHGNVVYDGEPEYATGTLRGILGTERPRVRREHRGVGEPVRGAEGTVEGLGRHGSPLWYPRARSGSAGKPRISACPASRGTGRRR